MKRFKLLLSVVTVLAMAVALALPVGTGAKVSAASDVTISTPMTFAAADASDGATDGTFNVSGNLEITGTGNIKSNGGDIKIVVGGKFTMKAGSLISSSGSGVAGDINIAVKGDIDMEPGSEVNANAGGNSAGAIVITSSQGNVDIDGHVYSHSSLSGTGAVQAPGGGPITIKAFCELIITDAGIVSSQGNDSGADLVHLEACAVVINGLVESTGVGHAVPNHPANHLNSIYRPDKPPKSTAGVEVWAGTLVIDGVNHNGEINADLTKGESSRSWIDLYASSDITIIGKTLGTKFTVHANNAGNGAIGGLITVKSVSGKITASGFALQADADVAGGDGGQIIIEASSDVKLDDAQIIARGDFVPTIGKGGTVNIRSYNTTISWQDLAGGVVATGDVRPTGTGAAPASRGVITFQKCTPGAVNVTETVFPFAPLPGVATTPTTIADPCGGVPTLPHFPGTYLDYVTLPACNPVTLTITKVVSGAAPSDDWSFTSDIPGYLTFLLPASGGSIVISPIAPGTYHITEVTKPGYTIAEPNPQTVVVGACQPAVVTFTNSTTCPTCNGTTITVDENVTVNFNTNPPTYTGDPDLKPFFSYDKSGATADKWKAVFNLGANALLIKKGATITVSRVPATGNGRAPGIEIRSTCTLEIEDGGAIKVISTNLQAGDIFIQIDGNIVINGEVRDEVTGTTGLPGKITIGSCCGNITEGPTGRVYDLGIDPGGNTINIVTCCSGYGDITINGLVMAFAHGHVAGTSRPRINVASFNGSVTINGNSTEPLLDDSSFPVGGSLYDLWGGLLSWVRDANEMGSVTVQALKDITVNGHGDDPTGAVRTSFAAIAVVANISSPPNQGGTIDVRSLTGKITGNDRAFQVYPGGPTALIKQWAAQDITLSRLGVNNSFNPVVDNRYTGSNTRKGGTNDIRSFSRVITINTNAQVLATGKNDNGANLLTSCLGVTNNGTVTPAPVISSSCVPAAPDRLFQSCAEFGVVCNRCQ